jgi:hypothetical protein
MAKITRYKRFTGGLSNKDKDNITQAGLGAGIFTAVVVVGGMIFIISKIGK